MKYIFIKIPISTITSLLGTILHHPAGRWQNRKITNIIVKLSILTVGTPIVVCTSYSSYLISKGYIIYEKK